MVAQIILVNYDEIEILIRQSKDCTERIEVMNIRVRTAVEDLRSNFEGEAADKFFAEMDQIVLPRLRRLHYALEQVSWLMLRIGEIMQEEEKRAALLMHGGSAFFTTGNGQNSSVSGANGTVSKPSPPRWETMSDDGDGAWYGASIDQADAIYVNGILNDQPGADRTRKLVEQEIRGQAMGIFNRSDGAIADVGEAASDKFQAWTGIRLGRENQAVASLMDAIHTKGGNTTIYCHSQGGAITAAALRELHDQGYDLSRVNVITMGSAEFNFPPGPNYEHRVNIVDPVPMLAGTISPPFDPFTLSPDPVMRGKIRTGIWFAGAHDAREYLERF